MELSKNQIYEAVIHGCSSEGHGVCRLAGRAVFVPGTLEGERWLVRIVKVSSAAVWGRGEELLEASPARQESDCPAYPKCGGCALRHMSYGEELRIKRQRVTDALQRIGGLALEAEAILPAEEAGLRRRKVIFNVGEANGKPVAGFYRARSHDIVPCESCHAIFPEAAQARDAVLRWMELRNVRAYNAIAAQQGVRHIFVRSSRLTEETVVTLIVSRRPSPANLRVLTEMLQEACPSMTGLVLAVNTNPGNVVLAGEFTTLWGKDTLTESLCGLEFELSPRSFFQVNPPQAEKLYRQAVEWAVDKDTKLALDLYCGTGTIGLCMAAAGARVIGAETVAPAVENAKANALRNGLQDKTEFWCADAGEAAAELARRGLRPDAIVVDPPRKGLDAAVIDAAVEMAPKRIVYVSCDAGTLARDLKLFNAAGYTPARCIAVDMFPRTVHVESVVLLNKE